MYDGLVFSGWAVPTYNVPGWYLNPFRLEVLNHLMEVLSECVGALVSFAQNLDPPTRAEQNDGDNAIQISLADTKSSENDPQLTRHLLQVFQGISLRFIEVLQPQLGHDTLEINTLEDVAFVLEGLDVLT